MLGTLIIAFGWVVPSRFNSIPDGVVREAGAAGKSLTSLADTQLADGNFGAATLLAATAFELGNAKAIRVSTQLTAELERNPQVARWGQWDPFLEAALKNVPIESYSNEPALLGILIARPSRESVTALLAGSRNPLVIDILETGNYTTYRRLFPVSSSSGRPLEVTLLALGLLAQGDHFSDGIKSDLRSLLLDARASGSIGELEDVYLDTLSLIRLFDWGQLKEVIAHADSVNALTRLRYLLHRRPDDMALIYSLFVASSKPSQLFDYVSEFGDEGFDVLSRTLGYGLNGYSLVLREQLPVEASLVESELGIFQSVQNSLAPFSLRNPELSLVLKYASFFLGSFLALYGGSKFGSFYKERVSPMLAYTQRLFGATASVVVFALLSEPYLSGAGSFNGYSFRFSMPVLAQVDGELQIIETTPTTTMETATLLSIAFFFLLQALVFLICMLKVREIEKRDTDSLVKLKLMENEDNLFDCGLYVGIAGTCISLVMQIIGVVEANLLAAYSSNLFGILCVAIVKIRLVRPYKTKLILASEEKIAALSSKLS